MDEDVGNVEQGRQSDNQLSDLRKQINDVCMYLCMYVCSFFSTRKGKEAKSFGEKEQISL